MNKLVFSIISGTSDTEEDLALRLRRNKGYITQCRSRKIVSERFIYLLQEELKKKTAKSNNVELTVDEATTVKATIRALSHLLAKVASVVHKRPVEDILEDLDQDIRVLLRDMLKG